MNGQLRQPALIAHIDVQRVKTLHPRNILGLNIIVGQRADPQVGKAVMQWVVAMAATDLAARLQMR
jgi:hypothetical protein